MRRISILILLVLSLALFGQVIEKNSWRIEKSFYGITSEGCIVEKYTLVNEKTGMKAVLTNYGATLISLYVPDREGKVADVVLGFDNLSDYETRNPYFGCIVGRYANRIKEGRFELEGRTYQLVRNNLGNHLHGGLKGFSFVVWKAIPFFADEGPAVKFTYFSHDGEEGYPGNLTVNVTYILTDNNELKLLYEAKTDATTIINLTHHPYWNLAGHDSGKTILDHELTIFASYYTPADDVLIPTGEIAPVEGTPFDFRKPKRIGQDIFHPDVQKPNYRGYDNNFVLDKKLGEFGLAARLKDPVSGRVLEVWTTEPGLMFYTGNWLDIKNAKGGANYGQYSGLCLEAQHFPDSPNHPNFPSTILKPGEVYKQITVYKFYTE
ncbi:aldose epimerase family protein [Thermotoga sp. 38H-to]|uniref:aldose epimerase family protein n=1 Tax=Thermotoga sp. 38H-to TaxID=1755812 RepID=UPI003216E4C1